MCVPVWMVMREVHVIGEALQERIEEMEEVERAFVHVDVEEKHAHKEHRQKD